MRDKVSIIVPIYNAELYLSRCLESLLNQTYSNIEIILVNDGSTDDSDLLIKEYQLVDDRIKYYFQHNSGPSEARNNGILNSDGKYLIFIDADDFVEENYVEILIRDILKTNSDLVCCGYKDHSKYGIVDCLDFNFFNEVSIYNFIEKICQGTGGVLWGKLFKKEIINKYNLKMDKNLFMSEDLIFVLQYVTHCKQFSIIKKYLYHYNRLNQSSITQNISVNYIGNYITLFNSMEDIFKSVKFSEDKIVEMMSHRIQNFVCCLIEKESSCLRKNGVKNTIINVRNICSFFLFEKYKDNFFSQNVLYRPFIFLIKRRLFLLAIIYGAYINFMKTTKYKVKYIIG